MTLRFLSLEDVRLDAESSGCECCGVYLKGTIGGVALQAGDVVVITDHPSRPAFAVQVALDDSAIVEQVFFGPARSI